MNAESIFSRHDYYPTPSGNVITYKQPSLTRKRRAVIKADTYALIVYLSSPIDAVDYTIVSDFFLIYRNFISPVELYDLLISRFRWCVKESMKINSDNTDERYNPKKIGEVALVRTFVLLRHWILNYFVTDFLPDLKLRLRFEKFLNSDYNDKFKIITSSIISLKKAWLQSCKNVWVNLDFEEPEMIGNDTSWSKYIIKDVSEIEEDKKRNSRLSDYALNELTSPSFRNSNVLSQFKSTDIFTIPTDDNSKNNRTGSMVLFPKDTLAVDKEIPDIDKYELNQSNSNNTEVTAQTENQRKIGHLSKIANISTIIKDLDYPNSPALDTIIPPTPAKKVEFILSSSYLPEELNESSFSSNDDEEKGENTNTETKSTLNTNILRISDGPGGLLNKWKINHNDTGEKKNDIYKLSSVNASKPELDNFVKYVISISSITTSKADDEQILNTINSKFDILSARTIDEVEYLINVENTLLKKIYQRTSNLPILSKELEKKTSKNEEVQEFSTLDNLNLYQTVSSIANSVISLSNSLTKREIQKSSSPFQNIYRSRRAKSASDFINLSKRHSTISITENGNIEQAFKVNSNGPQRLVFQDLPENSAPIFEKSTSLKGNDYIFSPVQGNLFNAKDPQGGSPLKHVLHNPIDEISEHDSNNTASIASTISYDSLLSNSDKRSSYASKNSSKINMFDDNNQKLKRKGAKANLREFTFEDLPAKNGNKSESDNMEKANNRLSTKSLGQESNDSASLNRAVTPASGRISIIKPKHLSTSSQSLSSISELTESRMSRDSVSISKIDEISIPEPEGINDTPSTTSYNSCVNHDILENEIDVIEKRLTEIGLDALDEVSAIRRSYSNKFNDAVSSDGSMKSVKGTIELQQRPVIVEENVSPQHSLANIQNLQREESSRFLEVDNKSLIDRRSHILSASSNLNYSSENESMDFASPMKDMEQLKNRFLSADDKSIEDESDDKLTEGIIEKSEPDKKESNRSSMETKGLLDIKNIPDESVSGDPLTVALMKLEGTYKQKLDPNSPIKSDSSGVLDSVKDLDISSIPSNPNGNTNKRRSLFLERRRQTIMNIPITPEATNDEDYKNIIGFTDNVPINIDELFKEYKIEDPRLLIKNKANHIPFILMYDSISIAKQLTLIEKEILLEIDWQEMLDLKSTIEGPHATSWLQLLIQNENLSGIDLAISRFNLVVDWIVSEIVLTTDTKLKRNVIQRYIHVADHCKRMQNYNSMMQIILALNSSTIQKYIETWRLIEPGDLLTWQELKSIPSLDKNHNTVRSLLNSVDPLKGCIPFIVVYLSDLSLNSEKRDWIIENQIVNYNKHDTGVQIVKNFIQRVQWSKFYDFDVDHELLSKCVYISALSKEEIILATSDNS
ncbi:hypothetical protein Kpol_316p6 [Vanderwaltozyma polyspora DSM 70294]|uniref:Guanine nucleotide exchange factor LTE1 n=1 Tax=Vanderwaltozyma polyspora (strain ATCC 22028 / DSM 70294 / BCRC 21397 / CBS 2163 / NBRC 10782 / NRRL Y-8283 / UCD 57-17) TaxID=436907 RepID=A7TSP6_VANPO|nr:uncharacterized protein Kpol_316p6 [Vanderwaltozyma polyspora DSM 70294]EDO14713.1 hypothetical protein Kpol_316p6 [Vanderwaltozyma polyspora DSM 70294]